MSVVGVGSLTKLNLDLWVSNTDLLWVFKNKLRKTNSDRVCAEPSQTAWEGCWDLNTDESAKLSLQLRS